MQRALVAWLLCAGIVVGLPTIGGARTEAAPASGLDARARASAAASGGTGAPASDLAPSSYPATPWSQLGPSAITYSLGPPGIFDGTVAYSGRQVALAIDPTTSGSSRVIYGGAASGGVWRTDDNGGSWRPLTDQQATTATGDVAIDPAHPATVLVGTGESNQAGDSYFGQGVLRSTDGGATWSLRGQAQFGDRTGSVSRLAFNRQNPDRVWAGTSNGLLTSTDNGITWAAVAGLPGGIVDDVAVDPATSTTLYVLVRGAGVYRSTDDGATFVSALTSPATAGRGRLTVSPSNPQVLYVLWESSGLFVYPGFNGFYYSADAGGTWVNGPAMDLNLSDQGDYDILIAVDPLDDRRVYIGGIDLGAMADARAATGNLVQLFNSRFGPNPTGVHADQHDLEFFPECSASPCGFALANDGGVWEVPDPPTGTLQSIVNLNTDLATTQFGAGDLGPDWPSTAFAMGGTQDNGTVRLTGPTAPTAPVVWDMRRGGDGGATVISWLDPNIVYAVQPGGEVWRSLDGGDTFNYLNQPASSAFSTPLALDRATSDHLLLGGSGKVFETTDATTWFQANLAPLDGDVTAVAFAPDDGGTAYAATSAGTVYRSTGTGTGLPSTWTALARPWGATYATSVSVDPGDPQVLTAGLGKFKFGNPATTVWQTSDGGASWRDISGSLPHLPTSTVLTYRRGGLRVIAVGTDAGAYVTTDDGTTWSKFTGGLPNAPVVQLKLDRAETTMVAFTHGRGAWTLPIYQEAPQVTRQPADVATSTGQTAAFTAAASGIPDPAVQWQRSTDGGATFADIAGATAPTYSLAATAAADGQRFRAVFTNVAGSATTTAATLHVASPPPPTSTPSPTSSVVDGGTGVSPSIAGAPTTASGTLPATGSSLGLAAVGLGLVVAGATALFAARRHRRVG